METQNLVWLAFAIIAGVIITALWMWQRARLKRARTWPMVTGKVYSTEVQLKNTGSGPNGIQSSAYFVTVTYSYSAQNESYSGRLRRKFMSEKRAEGWAENYPADRSLLIHYNPQKAAKSIVFEDEQAGLQMSQSA